MHGTGGVSEQRRQTCNETSCALQRKRAWGGRVGAQLARSSGGSNMLRTMICSASSSHDVLPGLKPGLQHGHDQERGRLHQLLLRGGDCAWNASRKCRRICARAQAPQTHVAEQLTSGDSWLLLLLLLLPLRGCASSTPPPPHEGCSNCRLSWQSLDTERARRALMPAFDERASPAEGRAWRRACRL